MAEYKRLGDYIREVNVRNRDLKVTKLVGLTIDKAFIPSVANVIGTDLSNYKVIQREQFACSLMQVSRDGKMPVAMFEEDEAIMSPAYPMFEVIDKTVLMPQYLMMWFSRSEFDREASYYAVGGVRGSLTWEDFCNMQLPIPSITRQREIVAEYETLTNRIRLNNQMIQHLEATAQALYRKIFVDNIDKENLPEGWRSSTLKYILQKYIRGPFGSALKKEDMQSSGVPVYEQQHVIDNHRCFRYYISNEKYIQLKRFAIQNDDLIISCSGTIGRVIQIQESDNKGVINQALLILRVNKSVFSPIILRYFLQSEIGHKMLIEDAHGSAQVNIAKRENIESIPIIIPNVKIIKALDEDLQLIDRRISIYQQENSKLTELQSLLLAKMGQ
jgi:type I restriction enzyme S subunit